MPNVQAKITSQGAREVTRFLRDLVKLAVQSAEVSMTDTITFVHHDLPPYPPPPTPLQVAEMKKHWTEKQRAFVAQAIRSGRIKVPYRRTGDLGRMITEDVTTTGNTVLGELGTVSRHAPWVVGNDYPGLTLPYPPGNRAFQARIHQNRWWQLGKEFERMKPAAEANFQTEFWKEFEQLVQAWKP